MLRFDDRFARQNRCEPPPEFPLASPYTGIVHHLSGPRLYALTQIHPNTSGSVDDAPKLFHVLAPVALGPLFDLRPHEENVEGRGPQDERTHLIEAVPYVRHGLVGRRVAPLVRTDLPSVAA